MITAYQDLLNSPDEATQLDAAKRWSKWEAATIHRVRDQKEVDDCDKPQGAVAIAKIEHHYFVNGCFLEGTKRDQDYILENVDKIRSIPTEIVQGR